jgi:hypothetical protein
MAAGQRVEDSKLNCLSAPGLPRFAIMTYVGAPLAPFRPWNFRVMWCAALHQTAPAQVELYGHNEPKSVCERSNPSTVLAVVHESAGGTNCPFAALQRFRQVLEVLLL